MKRKEEGREKRWKEKERRKQKKKRNEKNMEENRRKEIPFLKKFVHFSKVQFLFSFWHSFANICT